MRVAICCLNSKFIHISSAPWCLLAGVKKFSKTDVDAAVFESTINADPDVFADKIIKENPDVVSFCCYIWNITQTLYICQKIKSALGCTVVLGGPEVAYRGKDVLQKHAFIDYVLAGEGEFSFPVFLDMLNGSFEKADVSGLFYRENGEILSVPEAVYTDTPPSPYSDAYFEALRGRICYIESSRGCPFRCAFCLSGRVSKLRFFDIDQTKADIIRLSQSGTQTVKFVDRTFNASEQHANEILEFISENYANAIPQGICFHFEIAGDILKESTMRILSKMPRGAVQLEIGMQSFNENTLLAINRKTDCKKLVDNIKRLLDFGNMHIHIDLIAGLTGEDIESFEKSFNIGFGLHAHMLQMGFLKLLYGADMRENPDKYPCEFDSEPPYEVSSTPWLTRQQVATLKATEDAVDRLYNSGRFLLTLEYLLKSTELTPFKLFYEFGNETNGAGCDLGTYAVKVYDFFKSRCDSEILREMIVCDLLACTSALQIPTTLKIVDPMHKKAKSMFAKTTKIAILKKSGKIFAADHESARDFFGRFSCKFYDLDILKKPDRE